MLAVQPFRQALLSDRWRQPTRLPAPPRLLLHTGSLTRILKRQAQGVFHVDKLFQGWGQPSHSEAMALGLSTHQRVLIREVLLVGAGQPWVYARSILPVQSLTGRWARLRKLDDQPLGEVIFRCPHAQRGSFEVLHTPYGGQTLWARRSVVTRPRENAEGGLLIAELFLPDYPLPQRSWLS